MGAGRQNVVHAVGLTDSLLSFFFIAFAVVTYVQAKQGARRPAESDVLGLDRTYARNAAAGKGRGCRVEKEATHSGPDRKTEGLAKKRVQHKAGNNSKQVQRKYLEAILNHTNLPIYLKSADFTYLFMNRQFERLAHVSFEQARGRDDFAIFPEPVARLFRSQDEEVIKQRGLVEFEETIPLPDGVMTFMTAKYPLFDGRGKVSAVAGVCTDITAHKKAQVELQEAEAKYRGIFENSPMGIVHIDANGIITASNEKLAHILGSSPERIIGFDLLRSRQKHVRLAVAAALSGERVNYTGYYRSDTGSGTPYLCGAFSPIASGDGAIIGAIGIIEDATRRKQAEDALLEARDHLEERVAERTAELNRKTAKLTETNIALKILLEKRQEDKIDLEEKVAANIEKLIYPYLDKLRMKCNGHGHKALLDILQANLKEITSSFASRHNNVLASLTPAQMQVANMIRQGLTTKEIASLLDLSPATIACHRQEIRKRLALNNTKLNLRTALNLA